MTWRIPLLPKLPEVYRRFQDDDGPLMAAAVSYYAALSFFPLLLVLISALGFATQYTDWGQDAEQQVLNAIADYASPAVRDNVADVLSRVQSSAAVGGPLGFFALIFTAAALFAHFEKAFDRIWNVEESKKKGVLGAIKNVLFTRLRAFLMLAGIGGLILVIFVAGIVLASAKDWSEHFVIYSSWIWRVVEIGASIALNTAVFTLLYRWLPKVTIRWSEAFRGGLFAACLWEIGRLVLASFVISDKYSAYGVVGSFIAVMLWIYVASSIIFLCAEYIQVICKECDL